MEPLDPQDPLWKLLGQGREPEVRPNFVQNVVREARNTPQDRGWLARVRAWWAESESPLPAGGLILTAAAVVAVGWFMLPEVDPSASVSPTVVEAMVDEAEMVAVVEAPAVKRPRVIEAPLVPEVETQLESLNQMNALLAVEDTSSFSDLEIASLLY